MRELCGSFFYLLLRDGDLEVLFEEQGISMRGYPTLPVQLPLHPQIFLSAGAGLFLTIFMEPCSTLKADIPYTGPGKMLPTCMEVAPAGSFAGLV